MCDIMLEFDQCREEYMAILESKKCNYDSCDYMKNDHMLKVIHMLIFLAEINIIS